MPRTGEAPIKAITATIPIKLSYMSIALPGVNFFMSPSHRSELPASDALSVTGRRLLQVAEDVSRGAIDDDRDTRPPQLSEFVQIYREWIATNRGRSATQQQQAEQWQLVMHAMVTADDAEDAIHRLIRFGRVVWGERGPVALRHESDGAVLVFAEPFRAGPEGLIAAIWLLALTLCELEFLTGARCHGASGRVLHGACLPDGVTRLLFSAPLAFAADEVALLIPQSYLRRPVRARAADLPRFFSRLLPLTLGAERELPNLQSMVAGLIRDDKRGFDRQEPTVANVAARLGMSTATLGRRLRCEAVTFRQVKADVYNLLAQAWLRDGNVSIAEVAARLDFSDSFAFRRFFHRLNHASPSTFRAANRNDLGV